ncbi:acyl-CoA thioesterase [Nocardioides sp.]|uniref:acyl-CoA thioesterase n=1 Tax=Nocardioides sp. TaxID=35761 RepID=UPI002B271B02|nr:thioesterase family protein [Nocardioides sp.]
MAGEVFDCEIQARLRDINLGGHVDNVEAVRIIDEARIMFLRYAPLTTDDSAGLLAAVPAGVSELMGAQRVDYHAEMRFTPFRPFLLRLWISHVGRSSFSVCTEMRVAPDHPPALVAESTLVLWEQAGAASWPVTDDVRADLERYLAPPVALRERR